MSEENMRKNPMESEQKQEPETKDTEMQARYSFKGGQRGRYAHLFPQVPHVVILSPDVAAAFPDSDSVNEALRKLLASEGAT